MAYKARKIDSGGVIALLASLLSYVGWLRRPRGVLFLHVRREFVCDSLVQPIWPLLRPLNVRFSLRSFANTNFLE